MSEKNSMANWQNRDKKVSKRRRMKRQNRFFRDEKKDKRKVKAPNAEHR